MLSIYALHYASLAVYLFALIVAVDCFRYIGRCNRVPFLKLWIVWFLITVTLKIVWFIGLQYSWVLQDHNAKIGELESFQWLMFDWFNGLANLSILSAIRVYLKWNCASCEFYGRRSADREGL